MKKKETNKGRKQKRCELKNNSTIVVIDSCRKANFQVFSVVDLEK